MKNKQQIVKLIEERCSRCNLHIKSIDEDGCNIFSDNASGISMVLSYENVRSFKFYFFVRTHDVVYDGDRSDAHVILSLMFSSFLRTLPEKISCSLFDIGHPVIDDEIWGRHIIPEQHIDLNTAASWDEIEKLISKLIGYLSLWRAFFWEQVGCPCDDCKTAAGIDNTNRGYEPSKHLEQAVLSINKPPNQANYGSRSWPDWSYYYDIENEVTVIQSVGLSNYLDTVVPSHRNETEIVNGIDGKFYIDGEIKNYCEDESIQQLDKLFASLHSKKTNYDFLLLENMIVAFANPYVVALGRIVGLHQFKIERERLRIRHNKEAEVLFPVSSYDWAAKICPEQFEKLIKSLLENEHGVKSVRIPAPINQGDKGRDLLIDWEVSGNGSATQNISPNGQIKVVGQCKVSVGTVGKSKVQDLRDTVETHGSKGYFLAVSSQISAPLTEKLEDLKSKGIWTNWWNRDEIESRLSKNQELLALFPDIVKAKHQIKFVEEDNRSD